MIRDQRMPHEADSLQQINESVINILIQNISQTSPVGLIGVFPPPPGGQGYYNDHIAAELSNRGFPAHCIDVSHLDSPILSYSHAPSRVSLLKTLLRQRFSILHLTASDSRWLGFEIIVACSALLKRTPFVYSLLAGRFGERLKHYSPLKKMILGLALRRAHILLSNESQGRDIRSLPFLSRIRATVTGCTVPIPQEIEDDPALTGFLQSGDPGIISIGALRPVYGFALLLNASKHLTERGHRPHILLITAGNEDPATNHELRAIMEQNPDMDVRIQKEIPRPVLLGAVQAADILARPTFSDGDSLSLHEALQLGTPAVASDAAPRPPGVELHASGDVSSLADAILKAYRRPRTKAAHSSVEATLIHRVLAAYAQMFSKERT